MGVRAIARLLTEEGVPTYKGGERWSAATVLKILKNEKYCGDLVQRKTYTPDFLTHKKRRNRGEVPFVVLRDHHEAIIPREMWEAAQKELERRSARRDAGGGHGSRYALSGKITCEACGAAFFARTRKNAAGEPYRRWYAACKCPSRRSLSEKEFANAVREALSRLFDGAADEHVPEGAEKLFSELLTGRDESDAFYLGLVDAVTVAEGGIVTVCLKEDAHAFEGAYFAFEQDDVFKEG